MMTCGMIHQGDFGVGGLPCPPQVVAVPALDQPVGKQHGFSKQSGMMHDVRSDVDAQGDTSFRFCSNTNYHKPLRKSTVFYDTYMDRLFPVPAPAAV